MTGIAAQPDRRHALELLASPVRRDLLDTLANLPYVPSPETTETRERGLTAAELGLRLGLHVTTVRFHLDQLVEVGLVQAHDERGQVGRPKKRYSASPGPRPVLAESQPYRHLATMLSEVLAEDDVATAEDAGRRWFDRHASAEVSDLGVGHQPATTRSSWFAKIGALVDVLEKWGYAPEVATANSGHTAEVSLHNCPLRAMVETDPDIACGVHRGIIRAALDAMGEPDVEMKLLPMVQPDLCLARLTSSQDLSPQPPATVPATPPPPTPTKGRSS